MTILLFATIRRKKEPGEALPLFTNNKLGKELNKGKLGNDFTNNKKGEVLPFRWLPPN